MKSRKSKPSFHSAGSLISKLLFQQRLRDMPKGSRVLITGGGAASGKTSTARDLIDGADLVYDSVMGNARGNRTLINAILDAGHQLQVVFVWREARDAARFMVRRWLEEKRIIPLEVMSRGHFDAVAAFVGDTYDYLLSKGAPTEIFGKITDKPPGVLTVEELASLAYYEYGELEAAIRAAAYAELQSNQDLYNDDRIPDALESREIEERPGANPLDVPGRDETQGDSEPGGVRTEDERSAEPGPQEPQELTTNTEFDNAFEKLFGTSDELNDIAASLATEFGETLKHVSTPEAFDQDRYGRVRDTFEKAHAYFSSRAAEGEQPMVLLLKTLASEPFSFKPETIQKMKPYIVRFMDEKKGLIPAPIENIKETEAQDANDQPADLSVRVSSGIAEVGVSEPGTRGAAKPSGSVQRPGGVGTIESEEGEGIGGERPAPKTDEELSSGLGQSTIDAGGESAPVGLRSGTDGRDSAKAVGNFTITNELDFEMLAENVNSA